MLRASLKSVWAHKLRLALTALAIVLGVGLISGTFVYTDTIGKAFDGIFEDAFRGVDIVVSTQSDLQFGEGGYLPEDAVLAIADVDGVESVAPYLQGFGLTVLDANGEPLGGLGPPQIGSNFDEASTSEGGFQLREGDYPHGPTEVVLDAGLVATAGFELGDQVSIVSPTMPTQEYKLVGIAGFGDLDNLGGATFAMFDLDTIQALLDREGQLTGASVQVTPGTDVDTVIAAIQPTLPEGSLVQSGQSAAEEQAGDIQEGLAFFNTFLLTFAFIALFVGAFLIYNTFRIVVSQRTRELALFRALGARRAQVNRMVLLEALTVSVGSSAVGIVFGLGIATALQTGLSAAGIALPSANLSLQPRTIIVGMVVGVVVTLVAAMIPAFRAARVPPMAALREEVGRPRRSLAKRTLGGSIVAAIGVAILFMGLLVSFDSGPPEIAYVGLGIMVVFFGIFTLSPLFARPVAGFIGAPFERLFGVTGKLARENSMRSPRRTSATAIAVVISVTLVSLVSVMSASIRATIDEILGNDIKADLIITPANQFDPTASFTPDLADRIEADPIVEDVTRISLGTALIDDREAFITGAEADYSEYFPVDSSEGSLTPGPGEFVAEASIAESNEWTIGDTVEMGFELTGAQSYTLVGTAQGDLWSGVVLLSRDDWISQFGTETDTQVYIRAPGLTQDEAKAGLEAYTEDVPTANLQTFEELQTDAENRLDGLLNIILALLGATVLIGMLGVTNTMALSVTERKREIGLLRAVGLARKPTKKMVRYEAAIVSVFGAVVGVALGIFFGWAILKALEDQGFSAFVIPWVPTSAGLSDFLGSLGFWVVMTGVLGIVFAALPARRAAKLNVLEAISYE